MSDDLEPLPPLGALARKALAAEQTRPDVDSAMQDRVLGRVVASVAIGVAATAVAAGTAHAAAGASGAGSAGAAGSTGIIAGVTAKTIPWIVAAFIVGGGAGAAIHAAVAPAASPVAAPVTAIAPIVTMPSSNGPAATSVASGPSVASVESRVPVMQLPSAPSTASSAPASHPTSTTSTSGANDVDLAAERALVDRARTALSRGQTKDALDAVDAHATRFPRGRLSEEREALAIDALARSGRLDEATARAARFRTTYPNSVFNGVVDAAVRPR